MLVPSSRLVLPVESAAVIQSLLLLSALSLSLLWLTLEKEVERRLLGPPLSGSAKGKGEPAFKWHVVKSMEKGVLASSQESGVESHDSGNQPFRTPILPLPFFKPPSVTIETGRFLSCIIVNVNRTTRQWSHIDPIGFVVRNGTSKMDRYFVPTGTITNYHSAA
jgi:hypothetical protein